VEFETLSENYDKLHQKSQEIIHTLQNERDAKIVENEELKTQVCVMYLCSGKRGVKPGRDGNLGRLFGLQIRVHCHNRI